MTTEQVENEPVTQEIVASPQPQQLDIVDVDGAKKFWENYQQLTESILDASDYQGGQFKKKSAWRKYATAFNISDEIINEETTTDEKGRILSSKFYVKATAPNGRSSMGVGVCSLYDKITKRDTTEPTEFELRKRFSNAEHDIPATAHTRAKNRAISDLIGAGEVSAEEMDNINKNNQKARRVVKKVTPKKETTSEPIEVKAEVVEDVVASDCLEKIIKSLESKGVEVNEETLTAHLDKLAADKRNKKVDEDMKERILKVYKG